MKNLNKKNIIIMAFIGLFLGIIASVFGFWGSKMKPAVTIDKNLLNQEKLSTKEKTYIWIFSLINPVITGGVTYYMYTDSYPAKARQANIISFITFIPWIIVVLYQRGMIGH
jgi:hypothetical protein